MRNVSLLALPFFHVSFQLPSLRKVTWKFSLKQFSLSKRSQQWCAGEVTHTHMQKHRSTRMQLSQGAQQMGGQAFLCLGWRTSRAGALSPILLKMSPMWAQYRYQKAPKFPLWHMIELAFSFTANINQGPLAGWRVSSSVVSPISASLPKKPGIMRESSRQSLESTTIPSTERKREANPSHRLLLTHLFKSTSVF